MPSSHWKVKTVLEDGPKMEEMISIGAVASLTGLSTKTIRFYESDGYIPPAKRQASGYRMYSQADVRRLKLVKLARVLGLPLNEIRPLVEKAFVLDCSLFAAELTVVFDQQKAEIARLIDELQALDRELDALKAHAEHCECEPGLTLADCEYCSLLG
jgi:DNA-binding transcriptional MerR regulator